MYIYENESVLPRCGCVAIAASVRFGDCTYSDLTFRIVFVVLDFAPTDWNACIIGLEWVAQSGMTTSGQGRAAIF
jgi:hypothetical protein